MAGSAGTPGSGPAGAFRLAVDTGGTFTDVVLAGPDGRLLSAKVPTSDEDPAAGVLAGIDEVAALAGLSTAELLAGTERLVHGTTLGLNALLQGRGARVALLCTEGFRDALELRRSRLPDQWDFRASLPPVLVPRHLRLGVRERMDHAGRVLTPLDEAQVEALAEQLEEASVEAVAICLLFSFRNPAHEQAAAEILRRRLPGRFVAASSEIAPRLGEYERASTTVLNAFLGPLLAAYLEKLSGLLAERGWRGSLELVTSSGGLTDAWGAAGVPARTLLSGPAGGGLAGAVLAEKTGRPDLVVADMGGTSFDVHLVTGGRGEVAPAGEVAGYPLALPLLDIHSVGAGGGSVAWVDEGGLLRLGPRSSGSRPGPACYGRGGTEPTVTDACLLLGYLPAAGLLGGRLPLDPSAASRAFQPLAAALALGTEEAAGAVYELAAAQMADALRLVTLGRGRDPRDLALVAAGGAFPLFAACVAEELGVREVLVPLQGPVLCAWGMLSAGRRQDVVAGLLASRDTYSPQDLSRLVASLRQEAAGELDRLGAPDAGRGFEAVLEMRYQGQHHEISVPLPDHLEAEVESAFHSRHEELYGYALPGRPWELLHVRVGVFEQPPPAPLPRWEPGPFPFNGAAAGDADDGGSSLAGPALVELPFTSVPVPAGWSARAEAEAVLRLTYEERSRP